MIERDLFVGRPRHAVVTHVLLQRIDAAEFDVTVGTSEFLLHRQSTGDLFTGIRIHGFDENVTCEIHWIRCFIIGRRWQAEEKQRDAHER